MKKSMIILSLLSLLVFSVTANGFIKTFGGAEMESGEVVIQTLDGGYITGGWTDSFGAGDKDFWITKINSSGDEEWNKTFGGSADDRCYSIYQTSDHGYILGGFTKSYGSGSSDMWILKTDSIGNKEWSKTFGGSDSDVCYSVQQTTDNGYILTGLTKSFGAGHTDLWVLKIDEDGVEEWNKVFGGTSYDEGRSIKQTTDGGYIVAGRNMSLGVAGGLGWLIKLDSDGNEEWNKTFGGNYSDEIYSVQQTPTGKYILTGATSSYSANQNYEFWLIKTDASGNEEWNNTYGEADEESRAFSGDLVSDGGYIMAGSSYSGLIGHENFELIKVNESGVKEWTKTFNSDYDSRALSVKNTQDNGYILTGYKSISANGPYDLWLIKTDENGSSAINDNHDLQIKHCNLLQNYPNPFNPTTKFTYKLEIADYKSAKIVVYNTMGEIVWSSQIHTSHTTGSISFDGSNFNSGIYYYSLIVDDKKMDTKSMILIK